MMNFKIENIKKNLENPYLITWFLKNYKKHMDIIEEYFTNEKMIELIENYGEGENNPWILDSLFEYLPRTFFKDITHVIFEHWNNLRGNIGKNSLIAVLENDFETGYLLIENHIKSDYLVDDFDKTVEIINILISNSHEKQKELGDILIEKLKNIENPFQKEIYERVIFMISFGLELDSQSEILENIIDNGIKKEILLKELKDVYAYGNGHSIIYETIFNHKKGESFQLYPILKKEIELKVNKILNSNNNTMFLETLEFFKESNYKNKLFNLVEKTKTSWNSLIAGSKFKVEFSKFLLSLICNSTLENKNEFNKIENIEELTKLNFLDMDMIGEFKESFNNFDKNELSEYLVDFFEDSKPMKIRKNIIIIMGYLNYEVFLPYFFKGLGKEYSRESHEFCKNILLKHDVVNNLIGKWNGFDKTQKIYSLKILSKNSNSELSQFLIQIYPEFKDNLLELWCETVLQNPNPEILKFLEENFKNNSNTFYFTTYYILSLLFGFTLEDEIKSQIEKALAGVNSFKEGEIIVECECDRCNEVSNYTLNHIFITHHSKIKDTFIGGDNRCIYCEEFCQLTPTNKGMIQIINEVNDLSQNIFSPEMKIPVHFVSPMKFENNEVGYSKGIEYLKNEVIKNPDEFSILINLAHKYYLTKKTIEAEFYFLKCLEKNSSSIESAYFLGKIYERNQDFNKCNHILNIPLKTEKPWVFYIVPKQERGEFGEEYYKLHDKSCLVTGEESNLNAEFLRKYKIGKNDPCPCGSHKKFKKCCMRKGIY
jgi:SEC-C motif